jgi:hypothetical protein
MAASRLQRGAQCGVRLSRAAVEDQRVPDQPKPEQQDAQRSAR